MNEHISTVIATKSDEELQAFIDNREKYLPETVQASVAELKFRGIEFSDEELEVITQDMQARRELAKDEPGLSIFATRGWRYKLVDDPLAPELYSQQAITLFTIFFGVFFGSIMMAVNLTKAGSGNKAFIVVLYGIAFTLVQSLLLGAIPGGSFIGIIGSILGAFGLSSYFWTLYIGNGVLYKARPVWFPLLIALMLVAYVMYMNRAMFHLK